MGNSTSSSDDLETKLKILEEQNQQLDRDAKIMLQHDMQIREAYDELEKEKTSIAGEKNKLVVILHAISDAIIAVDRENKIITFNKAAELLTDLKSEDVLGKPIQGTIQLSQDEHVLDVSEYCPFHRELADEIIFQKDNLTLTNNLGQKKIVNLITAKIKEALRINLGGILTFHDVTEESQLEQMKFDFVSMAAHELRTPLTSIRGYLSVFIERNSTNFSKNQNEFLNRIQISADQLTALVERLLIATNVSKGVVEVNLKPTNWLDIVRQNVNQFKIIAAQKQINLTLIEPNTPIDLVMIDKVGINEVISNLLNNALRYTNDGGKITVSVHQDQDQVITSIQDTGEGIDPAALPHLFTKFFRAWGKLEMSNKGTGLGLYISKAIIDKHNGRIWAQSSLGKGSTFNFSLPIAKKA